MQIHSIQILPLRQLFFFQAAEKFETRRSFVVAHIPEFFPSEYNNNLYIYMFVIFPESNIVKSRLVYFL